MNLRNLSIGNRLIIGFAFILLLIVLFGTFSYHQSKHLWSFTDDLYNHPFKVTNNNRQILANIHAIDTRLKSIAIDKQLSNRELHDYIIEINTYEFTILEEFKTDYTAYLGPKEDITEAYLLFKNWKPLRDSVISLRQKGNFDSAYTTYKISNADYRLKIFEHVQQMIDFAIDKANGYYSAAETNKKNLIFWSWFTLLSLVALSTATIYAIYKSINNPIIGLTKVTDQYRHGDYNARSSYASTNEIGALASSFNSLANSVQQQILIKEQTATLSRKFVEEIELKPFCNVLLTELSAGLNGYIQKSV